MKKLVIALSLLIFTAIPSFADTYTTFDSDGNITTTYQDRNSDGSSTYTTFGPNGEISTTYENRISEDSSTYTTFDSNGNISTTYRRRR